MFKSMRIYPAPLVAALFVMQADSATAADASFAALADAPKHWTLLEQYCTDCHNFEDWAGGVAFDTMRPDAIPADAEVWEHTVRKLRGRMMPPPGQDRPDEKSTNEFVAWLEGYLDEAGTVAPDAGRVALHRLNRKEYAAAIKDLVALDVDPAALLPRDDVSDGFDNVANVLQVSPSFLDQYIGAARMVAVQAVGEKNPVPGGTQYFARDSGSQRFHIEGLPLGTRGGMQVEHWFPADGEYEINIADMARALWVVNMEFENTVLVAIDGKRVFETTLGGDEDMRAIDQDQDPAVDAINSRLKGIRFKTTAGPHRVAVTFRQRTFAESDDRMQIQVEGGGQDRILTLASFEIRGPYDVTGLSETPSRRAIFDCYPQQAAEEEACARSIIERLARKAFRRPLSAEDVDGLMVFYRQGHSQEGFEGGVRRALTGVLASPFFLYRFEQVPDDVAPGSAFALNDLELASRLSFFLWNSVPDDTLLKVAEAGDLRKGDNLRKQVERMLGDSRAKSLASNFAYQWLNIGKLDEVVPDPNIYPNGTGAGDPRADFKTEMVLFVDSVFRENRSVLDLMTADYTYLNEALAILYDVPDVKGDEFRRVTLKDANRWGILGKGAMLMGSSYPNRTSPVLRGAWILENITGTPPAAPPPNVEALPETVAGSRPLSVRERMVKHRENPSCNGCHGVLDPLGFALENFNTIGEWRDFDRFAKVDIDTTADMPDGTSVSGPIELRKALLKRPDQFVQTLTEKLMTYALGRTVEYYDMPSVRQIVRNAAQDDYRFQTIVMGIVDSDAFQMRQVASGTSLISDSGND
ncbi:MAG: DUF1592 domain-containing protein [Gammaproteobacteria bacterium]|nr:DUF1592 domain-containing protein [Gammaproteobacteria bacterium]